MSDRQLRTSTTGAIFKKTRKQSPRTTNDDEKQRERKRALDRKAQRASREKTRSHIAHLENMVRILSENNGSSSTSELMEEMNRLHAEINRLRKIIDNIKAVLGVQALEAVAPRQQSQSPEHGSSSSQSPRLNESNICEINSPSDDSPTFQAPKGDNWDAHAEDDSLDAPGDMEVCPGVLETPAEPKPNTRRINLDFMDTIDECSVALKSRRDGTRSSKHLSKQIWDLPSPRKTGIPTAPVPEYVPCKIWQKANTIYAKIFEFDRQRAYAADKVEAGSLVKVVKDGWHALNFQEKNNPVLQILKEVDQHLFWDLDPVTKIANLYKSLLLLKYYFNAESHNLDRMPIWQRPVHSQKVRLHPIPIDFFPWPGLRERLVRHHNYYFATSEFSVHYRQHFKFNWPFGFEETYRFDPITGAYGLTPMFEMHHRDVRCWSMDKVFFEKFPELVGEMSVHDGGEALSSGDGVKQADLSAADGEQAYYTERMCGFDVVGLFDECPPT